MNGALSGFLIETLIWTGLLIGLVLMLRRPVARYFGPRAAYALWLLPFLRLLMPPLVLPAWLAPSPLAEQLPETTVTVAQGMASTPLAEAAVMSGEPIAWGTILIATWLIGAAVFLAMRFNAYFAMRRDFLADGAPVGEAGAVRLVETPAAAAPVAFGVLDKVIALPPGFMALTPRSRRDLALAHELAHHRAHDLAVNVAAQFLFALHWFNPLSWMGWRAMRRDQEAACDARVIAQQGVQHKAAYADVIASFAAGPSLALTHSLAAQMACPVLGDKSIIHRLRSLTMSDISPRRRFAGRAFLGAAVLALPLTASISYAENLGVLSPPAAPAAPAAPAPPVPPVPFSEPVPPAPPEAPLPPETGIWQHAGSRTGMIHRNISDDGQVSGAQYGSMTQEEREELRRDLREAMADVDAAIAEANGAAAAAAAAAAAEAEEARSVALSYAHDDGHRGHTNVAITCTDGAPGGRMCKTDVAASAIKGLREARQEIASNSEIPGDMRGEILAALDAKIAAWKGR